jgi:hypothetical protein
MSDINISPKKYTYHIFTVPPGARFRTATVAKLAASQPLSGPVNQAKSSRILRGSAAVLLNKAAFAPIPR